MSELGARQQRVDLAARSRRRGMGHHQFSEELRLNGSWNKFVDYTAGLFYFRELSVYFGHEDLSYAFVGTVGLSLWRKARAQTSRTACSISTKRSGAGA